MFKSKHLDFAQIIIYIMIAFVLVTYVVLVVWYWQNKDTVTLPIIKNEVPKQEEVDQKYLDDRLYCETKEDCDWQVTDCGGCTCPEPSNLANLTELDCADFDLGLSCALACEHANLECMNNTCAALQRGDEILVSYPWKDNYVKNSFTIRGQARGSWFFEGDLPYELYDKDDNLLTQGYVTASKDWMTEDWVPFEGEVDFVAPTKRGRLVLKKDNPSGLPEHDDEITIYIRFAEYDQNISQTSDWRGYTQIELGLNLKFPPDYKLTDTDLDLENEEFSIYLENEDNIIWAGIAKEYETASLEELQARMKQEIEREVDQSIDDYIVIDEFLNINNREFYHLEVSPESTLAFEIYVSMIDSETLLFVNYVFYYDSPEELAAEEDMIKNFVMSMHLTDNVEIPTELYCQQDSDCGHQETSCNNCGCPEPKNNNYVEALDCAFYPDTPICMLYCPPTIPKCIDNTCRLIETEE